MGGYGAYKWGLTCPEKFAAIGGVAGSYHAEYRYQGKVNTVSTLCEALYGDPPAITPEVHDVFTLLKNRKEEGRDIPRLYTCCGTEDRRHQDSVDLKEFADQLGVPLLFEEDREDMMIFSLMSIFRRSGLDELCREISRRIKYTAKWGLQIAEMIFQTRAKRKHYRI